MKDLSQRVGDGVFAVDTEYLRPRLDASHLIVADGRAAFVDTGTHLSIPNLLATLAAQNLDVADVDYIFLTHVHLDHAGGAGRLVAALPRAQVLVHPRGAPHLIGPEKLIAATKSVYGERAFAEHYGDILPIPAQRITTVEDGHRVRLGRRSFEFIHTPGHALHHVCIFDRDAGEIFTGDTFGVSYRELDTAAGEFIFPATVPTQFDPEQLHASVARIVGLKPHAAYLTHYSRVNHIEKLSLDLHADIDAFVQIARSLASVPDRAAQIAPRIFDRLSQRLDEHGFPGGSAQRHAVLDGDVELNAAGLDAWLSRAA
jgi:glyoxylase-like metal-dependent hydrolase (beta-lactamase superfamily II)